MLQKTSVGTVFSASVVYSALILVVFCSASTARAANDNGPVPSGERNYSSSAAAISLTAVLPPTATLSISDVALSFAITSPNDPSTAMIVPVTSTWTLGRDTSSLQLIAFFDSPRRGLMDGRGNMIPTNKIRGALNGEMLQPFTETVRAGTPGASLVLFRQDLAPKSIAGSRTDTVRVVVDPIEDLGLPAGQYGGILHLRLVAF